MKLRNIRSFVLTAETASFSVAVSRCYLTQSAVNQHIKATIYVRPIERRDYTIELREQLIFEKWV